MTNDENLSINCDCDDTDPRWLTLAVAILPALLPVIFDKVTDLFSGYFERKRKRLEKANTSGSKGDKSSDDDEEEDDSHGNK